MIAFFQVLFTVAFGLVGGCDAAPDSPARLLTPAWTDGQGMVLVRRDQLTGDLLLWKLRAKQIESISVGQKEPWTNFDRLLGEPSIVYRVVDGKSQLETVSFGAWKQAGGVVTDTVRQVPNRDVKGFLLWVDSKNNDYKFSFHGQKVVTRGNAPLHAFYSPDRNYVAVFSVNGTASPPGKVPGIANITYDGPFYHEMFKRNDGTRIGEAVELADSKEAGYIQMVWSDDGKQLVYFDLAFRYVWVIDTPSGPASVKDGVGPAESAVPKPKE